MTRDPATLAVEFGTVEFDPAPATDGAPRGARYNIAPSTPVLSVVTRHPRDPQGVVDRGRTVRSIRVMRWGLVPHWAKDLKIGSRLINARAESAGRKPAFRDALARRRCLLPADGWYEWQRSNSPSGSSKQPFFITPADGSGLAIAGLWSTWRPPPAEPAIQPPPAEPAIRPPGHTAPPVVSCAVLTTDAVGPLAEIHDRMPLILPAQAWRAWLDPDSDDPGDLLAPPPAHLVQALELRPVSTAVNNVRHDGPELVERVEPEQPALLDLDQIR